MRPTSDKSRDTKYQHGRGEKKPENEVPNLGSLNMQPKGQVKKSETGGKAHRS